MCDNSYSRSACYLASASPSQGLSSWQLQSDKEEKPKSILKMVLIAGLVSIAFGGVVYIATRSVKAAVTSALLPGV